MPDQPYVADRQQYREYQHERRQRHEQDTAYLGYYAYEVPEGVYDVVEYFVYAEQQQYEYEDRHTPAGYHRVTEIAPLMIIRKHPYHKELDYRQHSQQRYDDDLISAEIERIVVVEYYAHKTDVEAAGIS